MNAPVIINQVAWDIGRLAQRLMEEYYTHMAALHVAAAVTCQRVLQSVEVCRSVNSRGAPLIDE